MTKAVATRISSEDERVLERSLLLAGGDGDSLLLLGGVDCLVLVGVVLLDVLGGVGGLGLGTGVMVEGWLTKALANSAKIKLVIVRVIVDIVVVLWLTIGGVYLAAVFSPLTGLTKAWAQIRVLVHLAPSSHYVIGVVVHGGGVGGSDGVPCSVASPAGSGGSGWSVLPGSHRG